MLLLLFIGLAPCATALPLGTAVGSAALDDVALAAERTGLANKRVGGSWLGGLFCFGWLCSLGCAGGLSGAGSFGGRFL